MVPTRPTPERRQQQNILRQSLFDAFGHTCDEYGVGVDSEVVTVLFAGRDGCDDDGGVARDFTLFGEGHFVKAHGGSPAVRYRVSSMNLATRAQRKP